MIACFPRLLPTAMALVLAASRAGAQDPFFERPPILYSQSLGQDRCARLLREMESGQVLLPAGDSKSTLRAVLQALGVPEWSQVLVFSKTSEQIALIHPANPRAVYFSDDVYVGYVPGGLIEVAAADPNLGMVFYTLDPRAASARPMRDNSCLSCHASARTERVPGVFVRSVFPDADGRPLGAAGGFDTTDASPLAERWGGWYVTGRHGTARHMGNVTAFLDGDTVRLDREAGSNIQSLQGKFPAGLHLRDDSDLVALLVLEHQCRMHNLIHQANQDVRRALWLHEQLHPENPPETPGSHFAETLTRCADRLVEGFLFTDETDLGEEITGGGEFARRFAETGPRDPDGFTLRELRLHHRLFKYRCSHMIHSPSFVGVSPALRRTTLTRLAEALRSDHPSPAGSHLAPGERKRIADHLAATLTDWPKS